MTTANVDADLICYRIGFTTQEINEPNIVASRVDNLIDNIKEGSQCDRLRFFLSDSANNFRFKIYPEYKAGRAEKPRWKDWIFDYLLDKYKAEVVPLHEADDALAMYQTEDTVCVSIDKDLLQIPGAHYNFVKQEWQYVEEFEGLVWFYRQVLMGDSTDNIPGLFRIGLARSAKLLQGCETEFELWEKVKEIYEEHSVPIEMAIRNARCMWCYREPVKEDLSNIWKEPSAS